MRLFDYTTTVSTLLTPEIVRALTTLHEHKGHQSFHIGAHKDELEKLLEVARIQSTGASNRIEGIYTSDKRLEELVSQKAEPHNRSEQEIAGYREVLSLIHESHDYITPRPSVILQLHRDLYSYTSGGGTYKNADNQITEVDELGNRTIRFSPVPAHFTAPAMDEMCTAFLKAWDEDLVDKLLLIPVFVLDFLCVHPFNDGNGRMSRLLTLLLLYKAGYLVGRYISLEMLIEHSKDTYYKTLQSSSVGWHEGRNDYAPFVLYSLGILMKAYAEFEARISLLSDGTRSKPDRNRAIFDERLGKITKKELLALCPDISKITVERALNDMVKSGYITKVGAGPATGYVKSQR